jgi:hypothetical protein
MMVRAKGKSLEKHFKKLASNIALRNLYSRKESVYSYLDTARPKIYTHHDVKFKSFVFDTEPGTDSISLAIRVKFVKKTRRKEMNHPTYRHLDKIVT